MPACTPPLPFSLRKRWLVGRQQLKIFFYFSLHLGIQLGQSGSWEVLISTENPDQVDLHSGMAGAICFSKSVVEGFQNSLCP